jgi:uncharacterized protein YkwD
MTMKNKLVAISTLSAFIALGLQSGVAVAQHEPTELHNRYRNSLGIPSLTWSDELSRKAQGCANLLASRNQFRHCSSGENLWMGTDGRFSFTQMIESWASERNQFVNGTFPNVSRTGNWQDVGHYTQMIWKNTTQIGCAGATGSDGKYRFVCNYAPVGNVTGQRVY